MDESAEILSKISLALTGIEQGSGPSSPTQCCYQIAPRLTNPPSYVVRMLLCGLTELECYSGDKSAWEVRLKFKGVQFLLSDWKRSSWSISAYSDTCDARNAATQLESKIASACSLLDSILQQELREEVESGQFYVKNSLLLVRKPYEYFRETLNEKLLELDEIRARPMNWEPDPARDKAITLPLSLGTVTSLSPISDHLNNEVRMKRAVSHNACAMLAFFFSYTEFLFDVLFAFDEARSMSYVDFRKLSWAERFKKTLPVSTDSTLRGIYNRLLATKRTIRDKVLHGHGDESTLLVPFGDIGLIPMTFSVLEDSVSFSWFPVQESGATAMLEVCESFDDWVASNDQAWYALRFAQYALDIPFEPEAVQRVRGWMSSRDDFEAELVAFSERVDYWENQY